MPFVSFVPLKTKPPIRNILHECIQNVDEKTKRITYYIIYFRTLTYKRVRQMRQTLEMPAIIISNLSHLKKYW